MRTMEIRDVVYVTRLNEAALRTVHANVASTTLGVSRSSQARLTINQASATNSFYH
jgi:hypothetical protein